ncbi:hypothetical protein LguiA_006659 [Lonicera macranthoides]
MSTVKMEVCNGFMWAKFEFFFKKVVVIIYEIGMKSFIRHDCLIFIFGEKGVRILFQSGVGIKGQAT